jgi:hypothetical protein
MPRRPVGISLRAAQKGICGEGFALIVCGRFGGFGWFALGRSVLNGSF